MISSLPLLSSMAKVNLKIPRSVFNETFLPYLEYTGKRFEIFYGGAGSGKSVFVAQRKVYHHLKYPGRKTLVIRKVGRTLRHSTFTEIRQVIGAWGLSPYFRVNKSDLEIFNKLNGNQIIFSGLDDVEKMKSISGITDIWIEEASEISEDDLKQLNLRLRGAANTRKQITLSFNPISALSWIKAYFFDQPNIETLICKTTYKDNRFLDPEDVAQIEALKAQDPVYWKIYGLGEWGVLGSLIFTNFEISEFNNTPDLFPRQYNGIDWGFNDPAAAVKIGFKDGELYILRELYVRELDNAELMSEAESSIFDKQTDLITADSAEPARIKEWRRKGWRIRGAKKGKDSVKFGIDFIRRHKIIIHPSCQSFINEIQGYAYRQDRDGNTLEEPVDFRNHLMDAMRYAMEALAYERQLFWTT